MVEMPKAYLILHVGCWVCRFNVWSAWHTLFLSFIIRKTQQFIFDNKNMNRQTTLFEM